MSHRTNPSLQVVFKHFVCFSDPMIRYAHMARDRGMLSEAQLIRSVGRPDGQITIPAAGKTRAAYSGGMYSSDRLIRDGV